MSQEPVRVIPPEPIEPCSTLGQAPKTVRELVPEGHAAHFVRDTVRQDLDLSAIFASYREERGYPLYHPVRMTVLLLYAYSRGIGSFRKIETACEERVDFMAVTGRQTPDHRTIHDFRFRSLSECQPPPDDRSPLLGQAPVRYNPAASSARGDDLQGQTGTRGARTLGHHLERHVQRLGHYPP